MKEKVTNRNDMEKSLSRELIDNLNSEKISPMMKQYLDLKGKYVNHILFFRLGDFYEMFFDDAVIVSKTLELTLTGRDCGLGEKAPMCGVPYHSSELYIKKLIALGFRVAICEQITDPSESKGIVERDIVRIVTPGTVIESSMLEDSSNNFICSAYYFKEKKICTLCISDISTGEIDLFEKSGKDIETEIINELARFTPTEIIFNDEFLSLNKVTSFIKVKISSSVTLRDDECFNPEINENLILKQFDKSSFDELGIDKNSSLLFALSGLADYVVETQKSEVGRFIGVTVHNQNIYMGLDLNARRNLELVETMRNKERRGSLLWVLDATKTSMGKRLLKSFIEKPLVNPLQIIARQDAVDAIYKKSVVMMELSDLLSKIYDIERLMTRVMYKTATPRDLKALASTAIQLPLIKAQLDKLSNSKLINKLNENISTLDNIKTLIENSITDEPPALIKDGGVIRNGFNEELDKLRNIMTNGRELITDIERAEKERTGIKGMKIGYNRVFGYYIEVTKSYYDLVPPDYIRKQTLSNCERFITEELKNAENTIIGAKDRALSLETAIFNEIREYLSTQLEIVQKTASSIATLDVLCSFAVIANRYQYIKPEIAMDGVIDIKDGRHPVVEIMLDDEVFVPNDTFLDINSNKMIVLTGPNMSGKSTFMRQIALITLMAQIGCFVPARYAKISVVDKIFTRIGASDDLTAGQSTFMVEMSEVADILKNATKNSLVILDEVGRGTSTFDGISIAQSVAEHICKSRQCSCKTLFATHYHELIALENTLSGVKNYSVAVQRNNDDIRFLRKIVEGGTDDSFGIQVAKLAGVPSKVISRAKELLSEMEKASLKDEIKNCENQISFNKIDSEKAINRLKKTHIDELSDLECRELLKDVIGLL